MVLSVLWISLEAAAVIAAETSLLFFLGFLPKFVHIFTPITVSSLKYAGADSIASAFPRVSRLPLKAKSDYFAEGYSPLGNDSDQESDMVMKELALSIFFVFFSFTYAQFFFFFFFLFPYVFYFRSRFAILAGIPSYFFTAGGRRYTAAAAEKAKLTPLNLKV